MRRTRRTRCNFNPGRGGFGERVSVGERWGEGDGGFGCIVGEDLVSAGMDSRILVGVNAPWILLLGVGIHTFIC
jgi:hypothetical protein